MMRAAFSATIGNMLEFYDFITYAFFAIQIGHAFFPAQSEYGSLMLSLATFGAGFITRPIGGVVLGIYSDRVGRRPAMLLSFALMGGAILVLALTPSYNSIGIAAPIIAIAARMVQGFALGGEVGPTTAYLMEIASPERRALVIAWQPTSQEIAATAGALVGVILSKTMEAEALDAYGWRIAFLIGAACLPFGLWMRRTLPETIPQGEHGAAAERTSHLALARRHSRVIGLARDDFGERHHRDLCHAVHDDLCAEHAARGRAAGVHGVAGQQCAADFTARCSAAGSPIATDASP